MENRKKLFIEINLPKQEDNIQSLLNNWTKPLPQKYHIINSPALSYHIATMPNESVSQKNMEQFFDQRFKAKTKLRKRNRDRQKYCKMRQQLSFLEQFLRQFKTLHQSQLLAYKQAILIRYLSSFINEICIQCHEKGQFFKHIWNTLIKIFEQLFSRIVQQSKSKEKKYLKEEIGLHSCYQQKIQSIGKENWTLKESDLKYQNLIHQMTSNIRNINQQLKATRTIYDKSVTTIRELTHKYQEMKGQYIDVLVNGFSGIMTMQEAQNLINDKETLLFAKQISMPNATIKCRAQKQRVAKIITNQLDINLLMEQIEAEECSFQIDEEEKKDVKYVNQKVQTYLNGMFKGENMGVQCDYLSKMEESLIRDKSSQTNSTERVGKVDEITQTEQFIFNQQKFTFKTAYSMDILLKEPSEMYKGKIIKDLNQRNSLNYSYLQFSQSYNPCEQYKLKEAHVNLQQKYSENIQQKLSQEDQEEDKMKIVPVVLKNDRKGRREGKMFRVGESGNSRISKIYFSKTIKTQGNATIKFQPCKSLKRDSNQKRMSEFLILQNLKQSTFKNLGLLRKNKLSNNSYPQKIRQQLIQYQPKNNSSIIDTIGQVMDSRDMEHRKESIELNYNQNLHLSQANSHLQDRYNYLQMSTQNNKRINGPIINISKCLKVIGQVFKMGRKFIDAGYHSINLITLTEDYLSALEGKVLTRQSRQKKLLQFFHSCSPIYSDSYIIRNYFLLCGIQLPQLTSKMQNINKTSIGGMDRKSDVEKQQRYSNINLHHFTKQKRGEQYVPIAKYIYSSEVIFYFDWLYAINCLQQKDDPTKFFTTSDKLLNFLPSVKRYYRNDESLYNQILETIKTSIKQHKSQADAKLNIFKCQQIILQKVLMKKYKITNEYSSLLKFHNNMHPSRNINRQFTRQVLQFLDLTPTQYMVTLDIMTKYYRGGKTIEDLTTAIIIEGFSINLKPLQLMQKQYKSTLIKRLTMSKPNSTGMISNMIEAIDKKSLKKQQFDLLLKHFWIKQCQSVLEQVIGVDLLSIYMLSLLAPKFIQFHQNYHNQTHQLFS